MCVWVPLSPPSETGRLSGVQSECDLFRTISQQSPTLSPCLAFFRQCVSRESGKVISQVAINGGWTEQTGLAWARSPTMENPPIDIQWRTQPEVTITPQEVQSHRASRASHQSSGPQPTSQTCGFGRHGDYSLSANHGLGG